MPREIYELLQSVDLRTKEISMEKRGYLRFVFFIYKIWDQMGYNHS